MTVRMLDVSHATWQALHSLREEFGAETAGEVVAELVERYEAKGARPKWLDMPCDSWSDYMKAMWVREREKASGRVECT